MKENRSNLGQEEQTIVNSWISCEVLLDPMTMMLKNHMLYYLDDNRVYGYVRFETGDEMSRRAKFAFITWIGPGVSPLKKAKVSTDKAFVKSIITVSYLFY